MQRASSIWSSASTRTKGFIGNSPPLALRSHSVDDPTHWLAGRVAVVTGASRGIGAATAEAVAAAGGHVVLAARDAQALDEVAARIRAGGGEATTAPTDVSRAEEVDRLFDAAAAAGPLAALVCAAGSLTSAPFDETTQEIWERTLA